MVCKVFATKNIYAIAIIDAYRGTVNAYIIIYYAIIGVMALGKVYLTLDKYLDEREISRYFLSAKADIRYDTINKYYRNRVTRYDGYVLAKICETLECDITDILKYEAD